MGAPEKPAEAGVPPEIRIVMRKLMAVLEATVEVLEVGQSLVAPPAAKAVTEMREGKRPLSREAFLLGAYQRLIAGAEDLISDLRTVTNKTTLQRVHTLELSGIDFNAIQEAIRAMASRRGKGNA